MTGKPVRPGTNERGAGLMEVIVATIVAVIAILALAYTFGTGRGLVNRYETARMALAAAQSRMEALSAGSATSDDLQWGSHPETGTNPVAVNGTVVAFESWTVTPYDDPATTGNEEDLRQVKVTVAWGGRGANERVTLSRLFPLY